AGAARSSGSRQSRRSVAPPERSRAAPRLPSGHAEDRGWRMSPVRVFAILRRAQSSRVQVALRLEKSRQEVVAVPRGPWFEAIAAAGRISVVLPCVVPPAFARQWHSASTEVPRATVLARVPVRRTEALDSDRCARLRGEFSLQRRRSCSRGSVLEPRGCSHS